MTAKSSPAVDLRVDGPRDNSIRLIFSGSLDTTTTGTVWQTASAALLKAKVKRAVVDAAAVDYCDGAGIALLIHLGDVQRQGGGQVEIAGLRPEFATLLDDWTPEAAAAAKEQPRRKNLTVELGEATVAIWRDLQDLVSFVGEMSVALAYAMLHPRSVRWRDAITIAEGVGVNALPIVALIAFLMGLIMAFQAAPPLRQFGAELFIANLVGLSILRELGPLMTAIILAGRSGSAFAAELGTMKVREEIDALRTMGLDPVRFLIVPRVVAAVCMTPLLTVFADLIGLLGGAVVMRSLGFPLVTYFNQIQYAVSYGSLVGGLVKAFVFGILVAGIGCLRGLQTGIGATAVGESTTSAVVSGIILIAITDGIFSVIYYYLWV